MTRPPRPGTTLDCPACGAAMRALALQRKPHGEMEVDLCPNCRGLWFDAYESLQLTPAATLQLFREVAALDVSGTPRRDGALACPRCRARLAATQDIQRTTRFSYWRCPRGHGRYTPFVQFMREKDFVRPLTPAEINRVRVLIGTVRCSGCGAPVDLGREPACRYCGARVEALDPEAIRRAVDRLDDRDRGEPGAVPPEVGAAGVPLPNDSKSTGGLDLILVGLRTLLSTVDR